MAGSVRRDCIPCGALVRDRLVAAAGSPRSLVRARGLALRSAPRTVIVRSFASDTLHLLRLFTACTPLRQYLRWFSAKRQPTSAEKVASKRMRPRSQPGMMIAVRVDMTQTTASWGENDGKLRNRATDEDRRGVSTASRPPPRSRPQSVHSAALDAARDSWCSSRIDCHRVSTAHFARGPRK